MRIRTIKTVLIAFSAIGFGLFTVPVLGNLYLKQRFGLDAFQRGLIGTIGGLGVLVALPARRPLLRQALSPRPAKGAVPHRQGGPAGGRPGPDSVRHAQRRLVGGDQCAGADALVDGLLHDRPHLDHGRPLPAAGDGHRRGGPLRLLRRGVRRSRPVRRARQPVRRAYRRPDHHDPLHVDRRPLDHPERPLHQERPLPGGGGDPRGDGGAQAPAGQSGRHSRPAAERDRLQLRARADPLRGQLRGQTGRSPRPPRDQRGRQVDRAPGGLGPRDAQPGRGPAQRPGHHLHDTRAALPAGHPPAPGRQGRLRRDDHRREPRDGWIRLPLRQGRAPTPHRARLSSCSRP